MVGCRVDKKVSTEAPRRLAMGRWATAAMCSAVQWELDHASAVALVDCGDGASGQMARGSVAGVTGKMLVAAAVAVAAMVAVDRVARLWRKLLVLVACVCATGRL